MIETNNDNNTWIINSFFEKARGLLSYTSMILTDSICINHRGIISVHEIHDSSKDNETTLFDSIQVINCTTYNSLFYLIGDISQMVQPFVGFKNSQFVSILIDSSILWINPPQSSDNSCG